MKTESLRKALLATFAWLLFLAGGGTAMAAPTETVTNLNNAGGGSLRQALANVNAGGTVVFGPSVSGTIDLQSALLVDKNVTIEGPGADVVTIDAATRDNILVIGSVAPGNYAVVVEGLGFFRGAARTQETTRATTAPLGGAIALVTGDSLTVRDSIFRQNLAVGEVYSGGSQGGAGGGAIGVACQTTAGTGAGLTVEDTLFRRNSAWPGGGAIGTFSDGPVTVSSSKFEANTVNPGGGGALLVKPFVGGTDCSEWGEERLPTASPVLITDTVMDANGGFDSSQGLGGAINIWVGAGPVTVRDSRLTGNAGRSNGGAIGMRSASPLTVEDSLIASNYVQSGRGGGISYGRNYAGQPFANINRMSVVRTEFIGNVSSSNDGAAIMYEPGNRDTEQTYPAAGLTVQDSLFRGNSSGDDVSTIYVASGLRGPVEMTITGSLFEQNTGRMSSGGTIWFAPSTATSPTDDRPDLRHDLTIESSDFVRNAGAEGGTTIETISDAVDATFRDVSIVGNVIGDGRPLSMLLQSSTSEAGEGSTYLLSNVTVAGNSGAGNPQSAIRVRNGGELTLEDSTVAMNSISDSPFTGDGSAGLEVAEDASATVRNSILANNSYDTGDSSSSRGQDCFMEPGASLTFEGANLVEDTTGCEAATGPAPITGNPGFDGLDPVEVQRLRTDQSTFVVPLAANSPARGVALGEWPETDQRGAPRPANGADLGAVQFYEAFQLTVETAGNGEGEVFSDRGDILCGEDCEDSYPDGETITLRPRVFSGSAFVGWAGACSGSDPVCEVTMDEAKTVTATFSVVPPAPDYTLSISKAGSGSGTVTSNTGGIDCGATCEADFPEADPATVVTLTATPNLGATFEGWSGACSGTGTCQVTMNRARDVVANFSMLPAPVEQGEIRIRKAKPGPIKVGSNRTFAIATVTCLVGPCEIEQIRTAQVRIRSKIFRAGAIYQSGSFPAGQSRTIQLRIPKAAFDLLKPRKSGIAAIYSVLNAGNSEAEGKEKVFRSVKVGLRR